MEQFQEKVNELFAKHETLLSRKNIPLEDGNGIFTRYQHPVLTAAHTPIFWRYDLNEKTNPYLMERIGMNATMNSGAIKWNDKYILMVRVEGSDRKSFFAVAESPNGVDNFRFWDYPVTMPDDLVPATNIYDMRLTAHEDGWVYGNPFAPSAMTRTQLPEIYPRQPPRQLSPDKRLEKLGTSPGFKDQEPTT